MQLEHSRALRLAAGASDQSETGLQAHLSAQHVQVSLTPRDEADLATAELLLANLARLPITLTVDLTGHGSEARRRLTAAARQPGSPAATGSAPVAPLRIHVGEGGDADLYAGAERHGGHVRRQPLGRRELASGLGAVTCAALASGEAFKALIPLVPSRVRELEELSWCPVTLSADPRATPLLTDALRLEDVALVGLGAIGTATARILGLLGATGSATLVDPERFATENIGTYSLGGTEDARAGRWKTELAARALPGVQTVRCDLPVAGFIDRVDACVLPWPTVVLSGLDSIAARRETQMLWPDRLLDAATGDTMCGLHDIGPADRACLRCLYPIRNGGPSSAQLLADATGLDPELLRHGDQPLQAEHLDHLSGEQRQRLAAQVGKPICGLARAVGLTDLPSNNYRPSVPFVSQQAACLAVGRLLADQLGIRGGATFIQYDALIGPDLATAEDRAPEPGCYCQQHAGVVQQLRAARAAGPSTSVAVPRVAQR